MSFVEFLAQETTLTVYSFKTLIFTSVVFAIFRIIISKYYLQPFSRHVDISNQQKFIHRGFDSIHYILSTIIGTLAISQRPYARCPFYFNECEPFFAMTYPSFILTIFEKFYFMYFASYYISDLLWIRTTKDIPLLIFHHSVTIGLFYITIACQRPLFGLATMVLHDWADAFLYFGKITTYLKMRTLSDLSFVIFAILFFYLRLINFGKIIWAVWFHDVGEQTCTIFLYKFGKCMLIFLYCCHVIWSVKIFQAVLKVLSHGKEWIRDTRSDS